MGNLINIICSSTYGQFPDIMESFEMIEYRDIGSVRTPRNLIVIVLGIIIISKLLSNWQNEKMS